MLGSIVEVCADAEDERSIVVEECTWDEWSYELVVCLLCMLCIRRFAGDESSQAKRIPLLSTPTVAKGRNTI